MHRRVKSARALLGALLATLLLLAPAARAADWSAAQLQGSEDDIFFSVSCPDQGLCVAVGSGDALATSTDPTAGPSSFALAHLAEPGSYEGLPGAPGTTPLLPGAQIRGVSCPSTSLCIAVSRLGTIFTSTDPGAGAAGWAGFGLGAGGPRTHLYGVSCPSEEFCVAVGLDGTILTSTEPAAGPTAWSAIKLPEALGLKGVSCASPVLCVAVAEGAILTSADPTGGPAAWSVLHEPSFGALLGVACTPTGFCVTGDADSLISSPAPLSGGWEGVAATPLQTTAFACTTELDCAALDNNADIIASVAPGAGASVWQLTNAVPITAPNGTFGISCPTAGLCVAAGSHNLIATSTEPFAIAGQSPTLGTLRRPTVELTRHPRKRLRITRKTVRVHFSFHAVGITSGFLCKIGAARFSPCRSPRSYRVGPGHHLFAVKAADPGGGDQTATRFGFRVTRVARHHRRHRGIHHALHRGRSRQAPAAGAQGAASR